MQSRDSRLVALFLHPALDWTLACPSQDRQLSSSALDGVDYLALNPGSSSSLPIVSESHFAKHPLPSRD